RLLATGCAVGRTVERIGARTVERPRGARAARVVLGWRGSGLSRGGDRERALVRLAAALGIRTALDALRVGSRRRQRAPLRLLAGGAANAGHSPRPRRPVRSRH